MSHVTSLTHVPRLACDTIVTCAKRRMGFLPRVGGNQSTHNLVEVRGLRVIWQPT